MKNLILIIVLFSTVEFVSGQDTYKDSLLMLLSKAKGDTTRVNLLCALSSTNLSNPDSAFFFGQQGLKLAQSIRYKKGEINCKLSLAFDVWSFGDYATAIKLAYSVLEYANTTTDTSSMLGAYAALATNYRDQGDYRESLQLLFREMEIINRYENCSVCRIYYAMIGSDYYGLEKFDSAFIYLNKSMTYPRKFGYGWILLMTGRTLVNLHNDSGAFVYYRQSVEVLSQENNLKDLAGAYTSMATLHEKNGQTDSAIYYGNQALILAKRGRFNKEIAEAYLLLSKTSEKISTSDALNYYKLAIAAKDSLYNQEKQRQITSYKFNEELRQNEIKTAEQQYRNRNRMYGLVGLLVFFLAFMIVLFRNNRQKQRAKNKIEKAYTELKNTQIQLIQSEKMASLGELTAGIAHEIQNPLNFVNNFSEVNKELIEELKAERSKVKSERDEELENQLLNDIDKNLEKIGHHGKRADSIVKGMLQHSRASGGKKEPTDINALADEYLRLAYHGFRAKDKSFNAKFETDFDKSIGKINVVPQDIGRVMLNLINNAFYAVNEKKQQLDGSYEPTVSVGTRKLRDKVELKVKDNGNGIPQKVLDKIFQPFFTTKPTGVGTGLGLSLSYDIIKAHGGEIKIETKEGEGAEFVIQLPSTKPS